MTLEISTNVCVFENPIQLSVHELVSSGVTDY